MNALSIFHFFVLLSIIVKEIGVSAYSPKPKPTTKIACFSIEKPAPSSFSRLPWRRQPSTHYTYEFKYLYNELVTGSDNQKGFVKAVLFIHPIGVGIARWYYDRLLAVLAEHFKDDRFIFWCQISWRPGVLANQKFMH
jgi:hypothetical protein